jgi:hypothetical protein
MLSEVGNNFTGAGDCKTILQAFPTRNIINPLKICNNPRN